MAASVDPLDALRATLSTAGLPAIKFVDALSAPTEELSQAASIQIGNAGTFSRSEPTRLMRSRNSPVADADSTAIPATSPDDFFALDAIVFAVQMASVQGGLYVVQATSRGLARFDAIERPDILAYLMGKRDEWEGVLSLADLQRRQGSNDQGPSTTPPSSPPATIKALYGSSIKLPAKRAYVPSKADAAFVKRLRTSGTEIILRTRNDALHGSHPWSKNIDFTSIRLSLAPTIEAARKAAGAGGSKSNVQPLPASSRGPAKKARAQDPIIMLSNSPTSLITMFNVKSLLEEGVFIDPTEARMAANGQSEGIVSILHRSNTSDSNTKPTRFIVVDNAETLNRLGGGGNMDVWGRVVAVFTTGQTWQFKSYRYTEAKELFRHVLGVYARWHNETRSNNIRDWPVTELVVDRSKRHTDKQIVAHFWRNVDNFIARRKSHLM
ncbi:hypothetical protein CBS101457_005129 [Exobasidium rhododendri]|nr:hypothetical protein CBS101457_005129 [Exobasidium rhododendri]